MDRDKAVTAAILDLRWRYDPKSYGGESLRYIDLWSDEFLVGYVATYAASDGYYYATASNHKEPKRRRFRSIDAAKVWVLETSASEL